MLYAMNAEKFWRHKNMGFPTCGYFTVVKEGIDFLTCPISEWGTFCKRTHTVCDFLGRHYDCPYYTWVWINGKYIKKEAYPKLEE
jgi:hypothetical protein